jgi:hypothetical protein
MCSLRFFNVSDIYPLWQAYTGTVEPGYNDFGSYDTSSIALDILWYQLIPHC